MRMIAVKEWHDAIYHGGRPATQISYVNCESIAWISPNPNGPEIECFVDMIHGRKMRIAESADSLILRVHDTATREKV